MTAINEALRQDGLRSRVLQSNLRACLDATGDAEQLLRDALGAKKLKELRRQRHRLAEHGAVRFEVARTPEEVAARASRFPRAGSQRLEGQARHRADPGRRRRQLHPARHHGTRRDRPMRNRRCLRPARRRSRPRSCCGNRTARFYFKLGVDERFARISPGVQLDARTDAAPLRGSANRIRRFHRQPPTTP